MISIFTTLSTLLWPFWPFVRGQIGPVTTAIAYCIGPLFDLFKAPAGPYTQANRAHIALYLPISRHIWAYLTVICVYLGILERILLLFINFLFKKIFFFCRDYF